MVDITTKIMALLLLPPGVMIVVALLGFIIQIRWVIIGNIVVALSVVALLILSLPFTGYQLMEEIESRFPPVALNGIKKPGGQAGAIVILGGGRYTDAREFGAGDGVNQPTLERLRYGARLHRLTGLPILVTGGAPYGEAVPEASLMQNALVQDFQVKAKWVENNSGTTYENAKNTGVILRAAGVHCAYLVTHAAHMPRAAWAFKATGIATRPAPMGYTTLDKQERNTLGYFPSMDSLQRSSTALRERFGLMWYKYKYSAVEPAKGTAPATAC
jgi:uncharacterized SAM-binding protein YcdF (DUF218 family)